MLMIHPFKLLKPQILAILQMEPTKLGTFSLLALGFSNHIYRIFFNLVTTVLRLPFLFQTTIGPKWS